MPTAWYGVVMLMAAIAYYLLQLAIMADEGGDGALGRALGSDRKGKASPLIYASAIPLAFVSSWIAICLYVLVSLIWLVPDRRLESRPLSDRD